MRSCKALNPLALGNNQDAAHGFANHMMQAEGHPSVGLYADDASMIISAPGVPEAEIWGAKALERAGRWLNDSRLILNMSKTEYVVFKSKKNSNAAQPHLVGLGAPLPQVEGASFLGLAVDETLTWRSHIDKLCKSLVVASFQIGALSRLVGCTTLRSLYFALFESRLRYGIVCWGNSVEVDRAFRLQKRVVRTLVGVWDQRESCRPFFLQLNILPLPALFILETLLLTRKRLRLYKFNCSVSLYSLRNSGDIFLERCRLTKVKNSPYHLGARLYNKLPQRLKTKKELPFGAFKNEVTALLQGCRPYSVDEYMKAEFK